MKITYIHQYFVPPEGSGGTRSYEFARRLMSYGHEVYMITSSAYLPAHYQPVQQSQKMEIAGVPAFVIASTYSNKMSFQKRIREFIRFALLSSVEAMRHKADVVFATSTPLTIAIPGVLASFWQRIPFVFEVRDLWPELPVAIGALRNPVLKALAVTLEVFAYLKAAHIVALSPGMAEGVLKRWVSAKKITVIPNSCDVDLFDVPTSRGITIRQQLELNNEQPLIVYTGTFGRINGVGYLVDVATAMLQIDPSIHFLLVGDGAERERVFAYAQERCVLNQNLWIWNPLPKVQMPDILAVATAAISVCIPLQAMENNSANKFFDALAAGKPVAINYGGWQSRLLEQTGAGIVLPQNNPVQAAKILAAFVHDKQRLEQAATATRMLAHTRFSRDTLAQTLEHVLTSVVEEHKTR